MAVMSCEPAEITAAQAEADRMYEDYRRKTLCLNCPNNRHHAYKIMGGHIVASYCAEDETWLEPDMYRSTIKEMGCEV